MAQGRILTCMAIPGHQNLVNEEADLMAGFGSAVEYQGRNLQQGH